MTRQSPNHDHESQSDEKVQPGKEAAIYGRLAVVAVVVVLQLWFLILALDEFLSGDLTAPWVLAGFSGISFLTAAWMGRVSRI